MRDKEISEGLGDMAHMAEKDHEVQMARADLYKIAKYSIKLHEMLKSVSEAEGLEGWVQSKITKAADYLGSVYHHLDYEQATGELGEARDTHCSDKCCGSDVKAEDCTCPPDCEHCNCNATNVNESSSCNCGDDCACGGNCTPDCTCSPDCKHCNCNAVTEAAEEKATCGCDSSCSHCGGKHTMNEVGKKCSCCDNEIKAVAVEGKFKSAAHRKAVHAAKASGKKKKKGLGERLAAKLAEKKDSAGIEYMKKAGNAKADAEAKERSKKKEVANERSLTKGEEKKKEKYVKGMKKAKGDFEKRYGKDAKAVMYATATKMAKK